jgi:hypothetical protein
LNKLHIPSSNLWFLDVVLHIAVVRVAPLLVAIERCGASVRKSFAGLYSRSSASPQFAFCFGFFNLSKEA